MEEERKENIKNIQQALEASAKAIPDLEIKYTPWEL